MERSERSGCVDLRCLAWESDDGNSPITIHSEYRHPFGQMLPSTKSISDTLFKSPRGHGHLQRLRMSDMDASVQPTNS
jgi:hypothetical protein